jgi:hypothetical protein
MTTIAYDLHHGTIAADGQMVRGYEIIRTDTPKLIVCGGAIYGITGSHAMLEPLIAWHQSGANANILPPGEDWCLLVIDASGAALYCKDAPHADRQLPCAFAFGTGREIARTAMRLGQTPAQAVALAIEFDMGSGGTIQVFDIAAALGEDLAVAATERRARP